MLQFRKTPVAQPRIVSEQQIGKRLYLTVKDDRSAEWEVYTLFRAKRGYVLHYPPSQRPASENPFDNRTFRVNGPKTPPMNLATFIRFLVAEFGVVVAGEASARLSCA